MPFSLLVVLKNDGQLRKISWATGEKFMGNWRKKHRQRLLKPSAMFGAAIGNEIRIKVQCMMIKNSI